ncbi:hypothetical protein [Borrelia sp. HM]|uniref:coiled-coil domain-containing protein n=1 Tax=Borrelia sp. HM TaxID=1882662 RepID=UPI001C740EF6|nr:hypothetical protein [Borrelia sp. HM]BCR21973.1 Chromosome partition protein Smc [Borrelia sp. HM]
MLSKIFILFLYTLLFETTQGNTTNYIINYSKIYIPKEDFNEDFSNKEEVIQSTNDQILKNKNLNKLNKKLNEFKLKNSTQPQILNNTQETNNILISKELTHPQILNAQNFYSEQENLDDWLIENIDNLKFRIKNYERKIQNIENLLNQLNLKLIKNTNTEYTNLAKSLKKEIENIKKLLITKENLFNNNVPQVNNSIHNNDEEYEKNQNEYMSDEEYDYPLENPPEENTHEMLYNPQQEYFDAKIQAINELDNKININKNLLDNQTNKINELDDKIINNEDKLLTLQKELIKSQNNNYNNFQTIEHSLSSLEKAIDILKDKIEKNEELYKESKNRIQKKEDQINELSQRLVDNESAILTFQGKLEKYQNKNLLKKENTDLKRTKNEFCSNNTKLPNENPVIKSANFKIYPDTHSNNYDFKDKSNEFDFKKSKGYYIEIEPTKNLHRAKEIYKLIPKYKVKNYFINPSLKQKEKFFRNLIQIDHINDIQTLYKNLILEFKNIRIIK